MKKLILASGSPRRREILSRLGYEFEIKVTEVSEDISVEDPADRVEELSLRKASALWESLEDKKDILVLAADTLVAAGNEILGKPEDEEDAFRMLKKLEGKKHQVYTGVTVMSEEGGLTYSEKTDVCVKPVSDEEIRAYIATGEPMDKAGAYAIQGGFGKYIDGFEGSYDNVVGLPSESVDRILNERGVLKK